ncbi:hypothetical protein QR680_010903 [Steinernema hermaphroditum]|uniref:Uncharacterized protein n=1 Tax=Steinernema hermaphroditum TaxID=289476 RepID=A0AA39MBY2_9BILA|nr:hypothetical protein QR680_010903 [Steinernema hermaphroditum]
MISPVRLSICFLCIALLLSDSGVFALRGALYRSGRAALPSGYQEFMRFGRSVPDQFIISRVQRASGGFFSTHDMIDPNSKMEVDADDGQLLRFGK